MVRKYRKSSQAKNAFLISLIFVTLALTLFLIQPRFNSSTPQTVVKAYSGDARYRYNAQRTGESPSTEILTLPSLKWSFQCPRPEASSVAVTSDTVYYICGGYPNSTGADQGQGIYAFSKTNGALKWRNRSAGCTGTKTVVARPMEIVGNVIYTYVCDAVTAVDATNGSVKWRSISNVGPAALMAPAVGGDRIYLGGANITAPGTATVVALRKSNGTILWSANLNTTTIQNISLTIASTEILTVTGSTSIQSIRGSDGSVRWNRTLPGHLYSSTLSYNNLYVGSSTGKVYAINRDTGADVWTFTADGATSPVMSVGKNQVVFATDKGSLYSLSHLTGAQRWKTTYGNSIPGALVPGVSTTNNNGHTYVSTLSGDIKAVDYIGKILWTIPAAAGTAHYIPNPVIISGRLYLASTTGLLRVY